MIPISKKMVGFRIECLLAEIYRNRAVIIERRSVLLRSGLDVVHLPDEIALNAFLLLGNYQRNDLLKKLNPYWPTLLTKGLVLGAIVDAPTPELRLMMSVLDHTKSVNSVFERLQGRDAQLAPEPPHDIFRCATQGGGHWGQVARFYFTAYEVQHLLIAAEPAEVFGVHPSFQQGIPGGLMNGSFEIPIDDGSVTVTMLHRTGVIYRHVLKIMREQQ